MRLPHLPQGHTFDSIHGWTPQVDAKDSSRCPPLVNACINGHTPCVTALIDAGANANVVWQFLEPVQWASCYGHRECVRALIGLGAVMRSIPEGRGLEDDGCVASLDRTANRLQSPPPPGGGRRRRTRKGVSARREEAMAAIEDSQDAQAAPCPPEPPVGSSLWGGAPWVQKSILKTLLTDGPDAAELLAKYPKLEKLDLALRRKLYAQSNAANPKRLTPTVVESISLRPGVAFGREDKSSTGGDATKFSMQREAAPTIEATYFGSKLRARVPHFVSIAFARHPDDRKTGNDYYKFYFGELLLCFACVDLEGQPRELALIRYVYPLYQMQPDGEPLKTKYTYPLGNSGLGYVVVDIEMLEYRAALVEPPSVHADPPGGRYWILNDHVYGNF